MPDLDVTVDANLTNHTAPTTSDRILIVRNSDGELYDITPDNLLKILNSLTEETAPASDADLLLEYDASAGTVKKLKLVNLVNGLTEDTNPDESADFLLEVDVSAGVLKKVKPNNIAITPGAGSPLQVVYTQTGAVATGTTTVPLDDTIPQNTEGDQYMTLAVTPTSSTNKLIIDTVWVGANSAAGAMSVCLFQDSTAGALASSIENLSAGQIKTIFLRHEMTAGTTSSTTFKIRAGLHNAGTTTFNGQSSARLHGGVIASSMRITEVKV